MSLPVDNLISNLEGRNLTVRRAGDGWAAQCPAHDDRNASLSISVGDDGRALLCCHAGCSTDDILRALGLDLRDLFPEREHTETPARRSPARKAAPLPSEDQLRGWAERLGSNDKLLDRLRELRGWSADALAGLGLGFDGDRLVFPIRDSAGQLVSVGRYTPSPKDGERKMIATPGRPRDLFPAPETVSGDEVWIVEGEPDAIAAATLGLPAVALPGVEAAKRLDVERFRRFRRVHVLLDCDRQGREAAGRIAEAFIAAGIEVRVLDLEPGRDDGYDLADWTREASIDGHDGRTSAADLLRRMAQTTAPAAREPAPDTGELLERIIALVRRFVVLPGEAESLAVALYVLHTWALDGAHATPYLLVISPEKRSGKTRLLEVLALLVRQPWHTNSTSEAAMFRKIEHHTPTLLLDEIDAIFGSNSERTEPLRAILNSGNRRGVTVTRCVGKEHEVAEFSVWCAKVLAGIDKDRRLPDTIRDRAIPIRMRRRHSGEKVARLRERKAAELAAPIKEAAATWAGAFASDLYDAEPHLPDELGDRTADAWEPLLAIADLAGGDWPARTRGAALELSGDSDDETSLGTLLLGAIRAAFDGRDVLSTEDLLAALNDDDDHPFGGWRDGKGLDARTLAAKLKPYRIKPRGVRIGDNTPKGYRAEDFRDAWTRYLDAAPATVTATDPQHATNPPHEIARKPRDVADVADVADVEGTGDGGSSNGDSERERTVADLTDAELLSIFPGSTIEHVPEADAETLAATNGHGSDRDREPRQVKAAA